MSMLSGSFAFPVPVTAAAGTAFTQLIPGGYNKKAKITSLGYTSLGTAHNLTIMSPLNDTTIAADAAASQAVIVLTGDPGVFTNKRTANNLIAVNDWLAIRYGDGTHVVIQLHGSTAPVVNADGTVTVTLVSNLPAILPRGMRVWFFGLPADVNPNTGVANPVITPPVSATTNYPIASTVAGAAVAQGVRPGDPILIHSNNITAAGILVSVNGVYGP